jgi:hypothetical protein
LAEVTLWAQTPTGTIVGTVTDPTGAVISSAVITIANRANGLTRTATTNPHGAYAAPLLPVGVYEIRAKAVGFSTLVRQASVVAGSTTAVDLPLRLGEVAQQVNAETEATPQVQYDSHRVGGLVSRAQIENLPLNGRNFLELAKLEPGGSEAQSALNRTFVSILGSGLVSYPRIGYTRMTVDGASIMAIAAPGAAQTVSQEVVQEFQISTVNMDLSAGLGSSGAINIVTRSGGNAYHGSGFVFYRDHNLAAYPGLQRDASNPDPFFQRQQFGYQLGGPIRKERAFFFTSYERNDQRGVLSIQPRTPEFAPLGGVFPTPLLGNLFNLRFDTRLSARHNAFIRHTHDGNRSFGPDGAATALPSGWSRLSKWMDQSMAGLTSVLSSRLVNDLRFAYSFISTPEIPATEADCPGCLGVGAPRISIPDAGVLFGKARQISFVGRRYQLTDSLVWQKDSHGLRFGFDWEHTKGSAQSLNQEPATINLYSPREVRQYRTLAPAAEPITLPASFLTLTDILRLPLRSFQTSVGPGALVMRGFRKHRFLDAYRLFASDTWRLGQQLTVNFGLGWSYEPNSFRADLTKPRLLTAILGDALNVAPAQKANVSPHFGFAWATRDGKTVIRGGAGRYFDPIIVDLASIVNERHALSPAGTGRRSNIPGSSIVYGGSPLEFIQRPTPFTAADLLAILPGIRADLERKLNPDNRDFTFRNLDLNKTGLALSDPSYEAAYALHFNLGVQRELAQDIVLSTDFAVRRFVHTPLFGIDYNRFNRRPQGPVIPRCTEAQRNDLSAVCSTGPITFDNTSGIATYRGLLVRLEKRFSRGTQFLVSYALANYTGTVGPRGPNQPASGFNNDNWFENYGPLPSERRHVLNLSGFVNLPWRFQASFALSASSRPPFLAYVNGMDFNGDGTQEDLLPGSRVNQFNRGLGKDDLPALVEGYNQQFANKRTLGGQTAPLLVLPANYSFHDNLFTQDVRLSRTFSLGSERVRLLLFGEVFNLFNIANLLGYSGNIANPAQFGQPGERFSQIFGSGGPRAFQLGMRVSF